MSKINIKNVTIGSDFELFIVDEQNNFISAIPFIEGTKEAPLPVSGKGHAIQADGVLFEANVPPVALNELEKMWDDIQYVLESGKEKLPKPLSLKCCTNGTFHETQLLDPLAKLAGCDPDFNAWKEGEINKKPDISDNPDRCCGFHFHIAYPNCDPVQAMRLIRILDVNLALPMLFIDEDNKRRKLYGKAGCFRFKDYGSVSGVEYRALSNCVIKDKETFEFCVIQLRKSISDYNNGVDYIEHSADIQEAINNYNLILAEELCVLFNIPILQPA